MMLKIVTLFLIGIAVLAMFGKLHLLRRRKHRAAVTCLDCGRPLIGKGPCDCGGRRRG
jgi:hypothetical protein